MLVFKRFFFFSFSSLVIIKLAIPAISWLALNFLEVFFKENSNPKLRFATSPRHDFIS